MKSDVMKIPRGSVQVGFQNIGGDFRDHGYELQIIGIRIYDVDPLAFFSRCQGNVSIQVAVAVLVNLNHVTVLSLSAESGPLTPNSNIIINLSFVNPFGDFLHNLCLSRRRRGAAGDGRLIMV